MNKVFAVISVLMFCIIGCVGAQSSGKKVKTEHVYQRAAPDRIITENMDGDTVYRMTVMPGDIVHNGNRSEIVSKFKSLNSHTYVYSWDFKISGKYKQRFQTKYHAIIAQWWNGPERGETLADIKGTQGPPVYLSMIRREDGLYLQVYYGLQNVDRSKRVEVKIDYDKWYSINAQIYWSTGKDGFAKIKINDSSYTLTGPNKYNTKSNDFKVGLYRNKDNKDTTVSYIKNISIFELEK